MRNIRKKLYTGVALVALLSVGTIHGMDAVAAAAKAAFDAVNQEQQRKYIESRIGMNLSGNGRDLKSDDPIAINYLAAYNARAEGNISIFAITNGFNSQYYNEGDHPRINRLNMEPKASSWANIIILESQNHPDGGVSNNPKQARIAQTEFDIATDAREILGLPLNDNLQQASMYNGYRGVAWFDNQDFTKYALPSTNDGMLINALRSKGLRFNGPLITYLFDGAIQESMKQDKQAFTKMVKKIPVDERYDISSLVGGYMERMADVENISKIQDGADKVLLEFKKPGDYLIPIFYYLDKKIFDAAALDDRLSIYLLPLRVETAEALARKVAAQEAYDAAVAKAVQERKRLGEEVRVRQGEIDRLKQAEMEAFNAVEAAEGEVKKAAAEEKATAEKKLADAKVELDKAKEARTGHNEQIEVLIQKQFVVEERLTAAKEKLAVVEQLFVAEDKAAADKATAEEAKEAAAKKASTDAEKAAADLKVAEGKLADAKVELVKATSARDAATEQSKKLAEEKATAEEKLAKAKEELAKATSATKAEAAKATAEKEAREADAKKAAVEKAKAEKRLAKTQKQLNEAEAKNRDAKKKIAQLTKEITELEAVLALTYVSYDNSWDNHHDHGHDDSNTAATSNNSWSNWFYQLLGYR